MAYTTIDDPSAYFTTTLYTGDGNDNRAITNSANSGNFKPDWLWYKERSSTSSHRVFDSTRGASKRLEPDVNNAEATDTSNHKSFDTNGFTVGTSGSTNANGDTYVAWQWKANGGTTSTNDASSTGVGDIDSVIQANTTAGFSIVTYTHTGNDDRVAHGLGATPKVVIVKERGGAGSWYFVTTAVDGSLDYLLLEGTNAKGDLGYSEHTSTTFPSMQFDNGDTAVAYCFAEKQGYSKFGSYTGNSNADGAFVYLGFKPAFVLVTASNATENWLIVDNKRTQSFNPVDGRLIPNTNAAEETNLTPCDLLSNGIKWRTSDGVWNSSSNTHIYMAFAESPFVSSKGVPTTAR